MEENSQDFLQKNIPYYEAWDSINFIDLGWSQDKKYLVTKIKLPISFAYLRVINLLKNKLNLTLLKNVMILSLVQNPLNAVKFLIFQLTAIFF